MVEVMSAVEWRVRPAEAAQQGEGPLQCGVFRCCDERPDTQQQRLDGGIAVRAVDLHELRLLDGVTGLPVIDGTVVQHRRTARNFLGAWSGGGNGSISNRNFPMTTRATCFTSVFLESRVPRKHPQQMAPQASVVRTS